MAPAARAKLSFKETRELAALPDRITALEQEQTALTAQLADPAMYKGAQGNAKGLQSRLAQITRELADLMARWESLEAKATGS